MLVKELSRLGHFQCLQRLVFTSGDAEEEVLVTVVDDTEPELSETFCVSLILPEGNVEIGDTPECKHSLRITHIYTNTHAVVKCANYSLFPSQHV